MISKIVFCRVVPVVQIEIIDMPINPKDVTWIEEPEMGFWEATFLPAIVKGLKTTFGHVTDYQPVTQQYPEQKPICRSIIAGCIG